MGRMGSGTTTGGLGGEGFDVVIGEVRGLFQLLVAKGYPLKLRTRQDWQFLVRQQKDSYWARSEFLEFVLNDATDGHCFSCKGSEFQHAGTMLFIERLSERVTKRFLLAPRVLWLCSILSKKEDISWGSRFLCSLKENVLMLCSNRSSIFRMLLLKNKGSACEIR